MEYYYFYKTTNKINGKYYYGVHSTDDLNDGYMGSGVILKHAILKYGAENFSKEIICFFDTYKEAYNYEAQIVTPEVVADPQCYNLKCGGIGGLKGYKMSEETREKISRNNSCFWKGKVGPTKGKTHSNETKEKIGNSNRGKKRTKEFSEKMSKIKTGKKHTDEAKRKISLNHRTNYKPLSDETKRKLSESHKGKPMHKNTAIALINASKNSIWINNGIINKRIKPEDFEYFKEKGFVHGMLIK